MSARLQYKHANVGCVHTLVVVAVAQLLITK